MNGPTRERRRAWPLLVAAAIAFAGALVSGGAAGAATDEALGEALFFAAVVLVLASGGFAFAGVLGVLESERAAYERAALGSLLIALFVATMTVVGGAMLALTLMLRFSDEFTK